MHGYVCHVCMYGSRIFKSSMVTNFNYGIRADGNFSIVVLALPTRIISNACQFQGMAITWSNKHTMSVQLEIPPPTLLIMMIPGR